MAQPSAYHSAGIRFICATIAVAFLVPAASCGGEEKLLSKSRDRDVVVDGMTKEWQGIFVYFEHDHANIGVMNDDSNIYVAFTVADEQTVEQIEVQGATLWFSASPDQQSAFGIRYPRGIGGTRPGPGEWGKPGEGDGPGERRESRPQRAREKPDSLLTQRADVLGEPEFIEVTDGSGRPVVGRAYSVEVAARFEYGALFNEAKVPLERFAGAPGGVLRLGIEGTQMPGRPDEPPEGESRGGGSPGGGPPGGGRSGGGTPGGGFSGGGPPGETERPEPIKFWFEVTLSGGATE